MLLNNGTWFGRLRPVGGMGGLPRVMLANPARAKLWENAQRFGQYTSVPQGYQSATRALIPTIKESSLISARISGSGDLFNFQVRNIVSMAATISGEGFVTPSAEVGKTMWATLTGAGSLAGDARMLVSMSARLDAGARPSAFDIAQEVWQGQATSYNAAGTMGNKLNSAGSGGVDYAALADAVRDELGVELARIIEIAKIHGLVIGAPLVVTPTSREAGGVVQTITGDGVSTSTVTRIA